MSQQRSTDVAEAKRLLDEVRGDWMTRRGVRAVAVALLRDRQGHLTEEVGIQVTVVRKLPAEQVPAGERLPAGLGRFRVQLIEGEPGLEEPGL